jgi:hypothetical protein
MKLAEDTADARRHIIEKVREILTHSGQELTEQDIAMQEAYIDGEISVDELKRYRRLYCAEDEQSAVA